MRPKKWQSNMTLKTSITNQNSPFLMGGGNYSEEVIGDSEEVFCERHKVGLTHFVLISFLENAFHKLVRWLSGKRSTAGFRFLKARHVLFAPTGCCLTISAEEGIKIK